MTDWLSPLLIGAGLCLMAAEAWAESEGMPVGQWFDLAKSSPWIALSIYLIWDGRGERDKRLDAYRDGAAAASDTADALRELARAFDQLREEVRRR